MTINVAVVTSESIVMGCDSISSAMGVFLNPFETLERDENGNAVADAEGNWTARFPPTALRHVVTWARSGVTKMFALCGDHNPVAATTAGLAALNGKNIANLVLEFRRLFPCEDHQTVRQVASDFCNFMSEQYEQHFANDPTPVTFRPDVEFLVGGYGSSEAFPSLYRINLKNPIESRLTPQNGVGEEFSLGPGITWAGQADAVERLLFGYDQRLKTAIHTAAQRQLRKLNRDMSETVLTTLQNAFAQHGVPVPEDLELDVPGLLDLELPWNALHLDIDVANIPLQDAIDFTSYLVNLQSGRATFSSGVPTVGGRTHIGVVSRNGFRMLNEPELVHRNTGYDRSI